MADHLFLLQSLAVHVSIVVRVEVALDDKPIITVDGLPSLAGQYLLRNLEVTRFQSC